MGFSTLGRAAVATLVAAAVVWTSLVWGQAPMRDTPRLRLPQTLQVFDAGESVTLNGLPMRLRGFVSPQPVADLVAALRYSLGGPLVVDRLGNKVVLGRAEGRHYVTVQVEPARAGSRGAIAIADLQAAGAVQGDVERERRAWLERLPAGSSLHSDMKSLDGLKQSRQLIYSNRLGEAFNRDRLQAALEHEGLVLERERVVDGNRADRPELPMTGRVLFFKGADKKGVATLHRELDGRVFVVLNLVSVQGDER